MGTIDTQTQYARIPLADGTLVAAPGIPAARLVLHAAGDVRVDDWPGRERIADLPGPIPMTGVAGSKPENGDLIYYAPWGNIGLYYNAARMAPTTATSVSAPTTRAPRTTDSARHRSRSRDRSVGIRELSELLQEV